VAAVPRPGDVIALRTADGLAYAQVVHKDKLYGTLVRVLEPVLPQPAEDLARLVSSPERFYTFFPVGAAVKRGLVQLVGRAQVPEGAQAFPLLRQRGQVRPDGSVADWWLWDGEKAWRIGQLTPDQQRLSIAEVVNDTLLRERIEQGWKPSDVR
jgi:hypothetical protein